MCHLLVNQVDYSLALFYYKRGTNSAIAHYLSRLVLQTLVIEELLYNFLEIAILLNCIIGIETFDLSEAQKCKLVNSVSINDILCDISELRKESLRRIKC